MSLSRSGVARAVWQAGFLAAGLGAFVALLNRSTTIFVGDSSEYYALYIAWKETLRPFMTEASWAEYARLSAVPNSPLVTPIDWMRKAVAFGSGSTADFNHFWFYSLLAAIIGSALRLVHVEVEAHAAFVASHWILLTMACLVAKRCFGWRGLAAALLLTALSPILWFVDKVHTEFFTYTLTVSAVFLLLRERYLAAAFFLAAASTQNISFGLVTLVPLLIDMTSRRFRGYTFGETAMLVATLFLLVAHPAYFFFRHGTVEPQLLLGGARIGLQMENLLVWFLDLDIGLFSNWPLGIGVMILAGWAKAAGARCAARRGHWAAFVLAYVGISLFAQSSTINLNSGGTRSIARYATWYLALFLPMVLMIIERLPAWKPSMKAAAALLVGLGGLYNLVCYVPWLPEGNRVPSPLSGWVQRHWPSLYNPPPEIFSERFGGLGESVELEKAIGVLGPDCRKILIAHDLARDRVLGGEQCGLDENLLREVVRRRLAGSGRQTGFSYALLNDEEIEASQFRCSGKIDFGRGGNVSPSAITGFGPAEDGGRWSVGAQATFTCSMPASPANRPSLARLTTAGFVVNKRPQRVRIAVNDATAREFSYVGDWEKKTIDLELPSAERVLLRFELPDAISPRALLGSADPRELGVWIQSIEFRRP